MKKTTQLSLIALAVAGISSHASAVEPASIQLTDGLMLTPEITAGYRYEDNFLSVENNELSSWITTISPSLTLHGGGSKSEYRLNYTGERELVNSYSEFGNTDHHITADAGFEFNARNRLVLNAGYHKVEDLSSSATGVAEPDKYNTRNIGGVYTYGAQTARTQIDLGASHTRLRYDNTGNLNADKERDTDAVHTTVYYRIAPRTRALAELRYAELDYVSASALNAKNYAALVGATWEATAKTTGTVKLGGERKRFDSNVYDDTSGGMWEVGINWAPRTYSTFDLTATRALDEGEDGASAIQRTSTGLAWTHYWATRLYSNVGYTYTERDYEDYNRKDELDSFNLGLTYEMRRWLDFGVRYSYLDNDSTFPGESYKRNIFALSMTASL
ncbi:outer membrane beta-barrel protein [Halopseudomonas salegens]|uniref:Uncharacterized protein, PEP-CTERM system associated n=1 Tax=Halopseudomonas salegens TaxID=1434072 RepID=A0A1H2FKT5_9GAMM|nr:outer membrane beta-barrel protein [Halopseudomonas salegens]SDU08010.1 uncharacterized protein, PEP-CTERM system associated [Halopseudomonas salegens]